jgi:hypothetical protein
MRLLAREQKGATHMRKIAMLLGLMMIIVLVATGVAIAVVKTCKDVPCRGSDNDDTLYERIGNRKHDRIFGLDGHDDIDANTYRRDRDRVVGGQQGDRLLVNDNDQRDLAKGGDGSDNCIIDQGDGTSSCENVNIEAVGAAPAGFEFNESADTFGVPNQ